jgi:hypothetical protein
MTSSGSTQPRRHRMKIIEALLFANAARGALQMESHAAPGLHEIIAGRSDRRVVCQESAPFGGACAGDGYGATLLADLTVANDGCVDRRAG